VREYDDIKLCLGGN